MVMDYLDLLAVSDEEVLSGTYYKRRPKTINDTGDEFHYDIVNDHDENYSKLLDSIETTKAIQTIKTNDDCGFKVKGYVVTQTGELWQITGFVKRLVKPENKQALRLLKETIETEYVIRLMEVDNPWGLK
jgi:hypothetical protein